MGKIIGLALVLSSMVAMVPAAANAQQVPTFIAEQNITMSLSPGVNVYGALVRFECSAVSVYAGWHLGEDCEGIVIDATGAVVFEGIADFVAVSPDDGIGGLAVPDRSTEGTVTCPGSQRACGPGSKFHAACDEGHGSLGGSNPDPGTGIPQTWSCTLP